jgi:asparagine synthetase B (glutamine-hydrolysing)
MGISVHERANELEISIPLTATDQLHYRVDGQSLVISDDLRELYDEACQIDETAVYSLLQFGAVVPPLSPWKQIRRIVPGKTTLFRSSPIRIADQLEQQPVSIQPSARSLDEQISVLVSRLDEVLLKCGERGPVIILFSGGVDSGLLAARAAAIGLKETVLVNYSFGSNDAESSLAEQMAKHLGLKFVRIEDSGFGDEIAEALNNAGRSYRYPFCDHSTMSTFALVRAVTARFGNTATVLDGIGADGAFGMFGRVRQWQRLYSIPIALRRVGATAYRLCRAWEKNNKIEYYLRLLRRTSQFSFPLVTVAQNPLQGIGYHPARTALVELEASANKYLNCLPNTDPRAQIAATDLVWVCSPIFAQRTKSLFDGTALHVVYPFLLPPMVDLALNARDWSGADRLPKWVLKAALSRQVPADMVYRKKSAFAAPIGQKFKHWAFLEAFDKLLDSKSALYGLVDQGFIGTIRQKLVDAAPLPSQTASFIWAAVFVNCWLEQVTRGTFVSARATTSFPR